MEISSNVIEAAESYAIDAVERVVNSYARDQLREIKDIEALNAVGAASLCDLDELEDCKRILNVCGAVVQFLHELQKGGVDNA